MILNVSLSQLSQVPPFLRGPAFALFFWWVLLALGQRVLRVLRVPLGSFTPWEKGLISLAFGAGAAQYLPYTLALFGMMTAPVVRIACGLLALLLVPDLLSVSRALGKALRGLASRKLSRSLLVWCALFCAVMAMLLVRALVLGDTGDDDGYHLASPKRWLLTGTLSYLPTYTNTNASLGFEMLYVMGTAILDALGAKLLHYSAGLFTLLGVFLCARRISTPLAGITAISLLLIATPVNNLPALFGLAYVDLGACWMAMTSVLVWLEWRERLEPKLFVCFALCAGFAGSFKVTALALALAWVPALVSELRRHGLGWPRIVKRLAGFGALSLAPVLPWLLRNWRQTGNPVYPMFSSLIPTRDWSAEQAAVFGRYMRYYSWGVASGPHLSGSQRKLLVFGTVGLIATAGALVLPRVRQASVRALLGCAALFIAISVASTGLYFRYWLPGMLWMGLAAGVLLTEHWSSRAWRQWPASALIAIALIVQLTANGPDTGGISLAKGARIAAGLSTFDEEYPRDPLSKMWAYINANTPGDARILLASFYITFGASSAGGFWIDRTCYATDSHLQTAINLQDWPSFVASITKLGVSHVVIFDRLFTAGRHGFSFPAGEHEPAFSRRLVDEYGEKLVQFEHAQLYRVRVSDALLDARPKSATH
ncbi:MAG: hypothetical protein ABJB12_12220 [Pseudomonadota bacterium]